MTKRSLILTVLAVVCFIAAIISLIIEKKAVINDYEDGGADLEPDHEPGPEEKTEPLINIEDVGTDK